MKQTINKNRYWYILTLAACLYCTPLWAEDFHYAGEFMNLGAGARATGMGNTYVAIVNDATSCYWNPAGLAKLEGKEVTFMHSEQFGDLINYDFIAYAVPLKGIGGMGVALVRLGISGIHYTTLKDTSNSTIDENNPIVSYKTVSNNDYCLLLTQGRYFNKYNLSLGLTVKIIRRELGDDYAHGIGFDVGAQYMLRPNISLGLSIKDITSSIVSWNNGTRDFIMPSVHLGASYTRWLEVFHGNVTFSAGSFLISEIMGNFFITDNLNLKDSELLEPIASGGIGLEYNFKDKIFIRGGAIMDNLTLGAGLQLNRFAVDYAFLQHSMFNDNLKGDLDNTHRVSGTIRF